jgi:hypothetical protein
LPDEQCACLLLKYEHEERVVRKPPSRTPATATLVTGFLQSLRDPDAASALSLAPAVRRLYGLAAERDLSRDDARKFIARKYGVDVNS